MSCQNYVYFCAVCIVGLMVFRVQPKGAWAKSWSPLGLLRGFRMRYNKYLVSTQLVCSCLCVGNVDARIQMKGIAYYSVNSLMLAVAHFVCGHARCSVLNQCEAANPRYMSPTVTVHGTPGSSFPT